MKIKSLSNNLRNKLYGRIISKNFDLVTEDDFNPDVVYLFGLDSVDSGCKLGCAAGLTLAGVIFLVTARFEKKKRIKEFEKGFEAGYKKRGELEDEIYTSYTESIDSILNENPDLVDDFD